MKRLFVLRHAKSSWDHPDLTDFERPLNKRGKKTAPFMGTLMSGKELVPDFALCSPAERARQTLSLVQESASFVFEIEYDRRIYGASSNSLIHIVSELDNEIHAPIIIGHNPGFEGIVQILVGKYERMPTAALAVIDLNIDEWNDIAGESGTLIELLRPKDEKKRLQNT
jgi:phosphohistidine phosphatase